MKEEVPKDKFIFEIYDDLTEGSANQRYSHNLDSSQEIQILVDLAGNIKLVNPYIFVILGFKPQEVIGKSVFDFVNPEDISLATKMLHKVAKDIPHTKIYIRARHSNNSYVLLEIIGNILMDKHDSLSLIVLTCHAAVDKENPIDKYLSGSEQLLNLIFENAVDGISVYEEFPEKGSRKLLKCNSRYVEISGHSMNELLTSENAHIHQRTLDADPVTRKSFDEAFKKSGVYKGYFSWIRPDNKKNIVEFTGVPIKIGDRILVVGIDRDITDRINENEEKLLLYDRINRQQKAIVKLSTSEEIIKGNSQIGFSIITETAAQVIDIERVSIWIGRYEESILTCIDLFQKSAGVHTHGQSFSKKDFLEYFKALNKYRIIDATDVYHDLRNSEFANSYMNYNQTISILDTPIWYSGNLYGVVCFENVEIARKWSSEDIHFASEIADQTAQTLLYQDRYKTAQTLLQSEHQLRELNATKDMFFSIIAHDLRSPFNSIIGMSELLSSSFYSFSSEKVIHLISKIHESSKATYELLENLLAWAKAQSDNLVVDMKPVRLQQSLIECIPLLEEQAHVKGIKINLYIPHNVCVSADKNLLTTVLRNLINNAIKFTHKGGVINIQCAETKNEVVVIISDTGIGIPEEYIANLFKIESKHSTAGTENEKGTGLGLILCKNFVEKMGGTIWLTSQPGLGSSFSFTLSSA